MRRLCPLILMLSLLGCGTIYQGTTIREGVVDGAKVRVIPLTPETLLAANASPYRPRALPAAFHSTAGTHGSARPGAAPAPVYTAPAADGTTPPETRLPPPPPEAPYRIGIGDVVLLATRAPGPNPAEHSGLLTAETRRQGYTVQDDGSISLPDVGRIPIAEMTLEEAEAALFRSLVAKQIDPAFSLEISGFNARKVSIGGGVLRPGVVPVALTPLTLDRAIADAGGITAPDRASAVIRIYRAGTLYQLPLTAFLSNPQQQKIRLIDGDSVFVDTAYDLARAEAYFSQQIRLAEFTQGSRNAALAALTQEVALRRAELTEARSNFTARLELGAEARDYVYLTGEIRTPGRMALPFEQPLSLADALFEKGGPATRTGNPRQIYVMRGASDPRAFGAITAWHIDAGTPTGMVLATRMELRPDDVIFVAEQPVARWNRVIDQISPSLIAIPLNQAAEN